MPGRQGTTGRTPLGAGPPGSQRARPGEDSLVVLMFFTAGIIFLDRFGIAYAFPRIKPDLGLDNTQLGLTMAITSVCWAISGVACSLVSDRLLRGRRKTIIIASLVLFSLTTAATGLVHSFGQLMVLRAVVGAVQGPAVPLIQSAVAAASSPHRRGRNLGIVIAGIAVIGGALPPLVVIHLTEAVGWRSTFTILGAPGLVLAVAVAVVMKEPRAGAAGAQAAAPPAWSEVRRVLLRRNVLLGAVITIAVIGYETVFSSFSALYFTRSSTLSSGEVAGVLGAYGLMIAVGAVIASAWSDRAGRKPVFLAAAACTALTPVGLLLVHDHVGALLAVVALQLVGGGTQVLGTYVIPGESVPPALAATTFAVLTALAEVIGGGAAPTLGGALADAFGIGAPLWLAAAVGVVALVAGLFLRETLPSRASRAGTRPAPAPRTVEEPAPLA